MEMYLRLQIVRSSSPITSHLGTILAIPHPHSAGVANGRSDCPDAPSPGPSPARRPSERHWQRPGKRKWQGFSKANNLRWCPRRGRSIWPWQQRSRSSDPPTAQPHPGRQKSKLELSQAAPQHALLPLPRPRAAPKQCRRGGMIQTLPAGPRSSGLSACSSLEERATPGWAWKRRSAGSTSPQAAS